MTPAREGRAGRMMGRRVRPGRRATAVRWLLLLGSCGLVTPLAALGSAPRFAPRPLEHEAQVATDATEGGALRIVSLLPAATAILEEVGAGAAVVGIASDDPRAGEGGSPPVVGSVLRPDAERILAADPDLVVVWSGAETSALADALQARGVALMRADFDRVAVVPPLIRDLATRVGRQATGDHLATTIEERLARIREAVPANRPRVLWVVGHEPPFTAGPGSLPDDLIAIAGGINVMADAGAAWFRPAPEQLRARAVDLVVWPVGPGLPPLAELPDASPWRLIPAVREGQVLHVDADLVHEAGPRIADAAALLHDLFRRGVRRAASHQDTRR